MNKFFKIFLGFLILLMVTSCGKDFFQKVDTRKTPIKGSERAKKNIEEGRGRGVGNILGIGNKGTNYEFSTSNPLWRATLDVLDFLPLSTVDYSGGVIITDWYSTMSNENERCKLNIFITGRELNTENLRVTSFCQEFKDPSWINKEVNKENNLVEIIEIPSHIWFVGVQFHPEYKSSVTNPHPLFSSFISACLKNKKK